jgi:hypothetical protein
MVANGLDFDAAHGIVVRVIEQVRFYFYGFGNPAAVSRA